MQCSESRKEAARLTPLLTPRTLVRLATWNIRTMYVGTSGTGTSGQADTAKEVGLDRTYPEEASIQHHTPSPDLKPAGEEGQPHNSWRRDTVAELKQQGTNWSGMTRAAQNRERWRGVVDDLCSTGSDGHK